MQNDFKLFLISLYYYDNYDNMTLHIWTSIVTTSIVTMYDIFYFEGNIKLELNNSYCYDWKGKVSAVVTQHYCT
jgi:hypothetical protein